MTTPFLTIKKWSGINNQSGPNAKLNSMELKAGECVTATNVNIDDKSRINLRRGSVKTLTGTFRNIDPDGSGLCIQGDTNLVMLMMNAAGVYSYVVVRSGLTPGATMDFVNVNNMQIWCTNGHEIGWVTPDLQWHDLPAVDFGVNNTAIAAKMRQTRMKLPAGYFIEQWNGRIYSMQNGVVYFSDSMAFHRCHNENGFFMTAGRGTMLKAVQGGIWYADGKIWFISGKDITMDSENIPKAEYNAIYGSATIVPGNLTGVRELAATEDCVVFWTEHGICVGGPEGEFFNLTNKVYHPKKYSGAHSIFRQRPGMNQVVTILN